MNRRMIRGMMIGLLSFFLIAPIHAAMDLKVDDVLKKETLKPKGAWETVLAPDTLDLAERAKMSINVLVNTMDPKMYYGVIGCEFSPAPKFTGYPGWDMTPKNARSLATLRVMCGSEQGLDVEYGAMHALLDAVSENGRVYLPFDGPGVPIGTCYPQTVAMTIFAALNFQGRDGNPLWSQWIARMGAGLRGMAIPVEDRAFYPMQAGIDPQGQWHIRNLEAAPPFKPQGTLEIQPYR